jgi:sortase A
MASDDDTNSHRLSRHDKVIQPLNPSVRPEAAPYHQEALKQTGGNPALDLIRQKLNELYDKEPSAKEEKQEVENLSRRSKHQQYMYNLSRSGRSLAEIQTAWHNYYVALPDTEKHQVWQEFYAAHGHSFPQPAAPAPQPKEEKPEPSKPAHKRDAKPRKAPARKSDPRTVGEVKEQLLHKVSSRGKRASKHQHVQSLTFGFSAGLMVVLIMLFGFFNERFIAPFITPSRAVSSTPIIIDPNSTAVDPEPKVIIPKINVEIPVVYDEPSIDEHRIQAALERGVVHYATTPNPGEKGNAVIFGHSANNILNKGKYKFAFVLLKQLEPNDTFYLQKDGKRYVYKVFDKKIVPPSDVSVLNPTDKIATVTLITCDPPGTNLNRLVVVAEQISPDPNANAVSAVKTTTQNQPAELPGNSPSLWSRIREWFQ